MALKRFSDPTAKISIVEPDPMVRVEFTMRMSEWRLLADALSGPSRDFYELLQKRRSELAGQPTPEIFADVLHGVARIADAAAQAVTICVAERQS